MKKSALILLSLCAFAAVFMSCGGPTTITDESVARRNSVMARADNGYTLSLSDYYDTLKKSWYITKGGILDVKTAEAFRDSLIMDTLAGFEADLIDLREYTPFYVTFRERYIAYLGDQYWKQAVFEKVSADSQEVVDFYNSRPDLFALPDYVYVKHIFAGADGLRKGKDSLKYRKLSLKELEPKVKEYIFDVKRKIDSGLSFDSAAKAYSMDQATSRTGGHLGWIPKGEYVHPFDSVAFGLRNNEISQPYRDKDGWQILHIERRVEEGVQPYDSLWYRVARGNLLQLKANSRADSIKTDLFKAFDLELNPAIRDTNIYLVDETLWCAIVNNRDTIFAYEMKKVEGTWRKVRRVANTDAAIKVEMAKEIARRYLVLAAARSMGIDTQLATVATRASLIHGTAKAITLAAQRTSQMIPSDSAVDAYYQAHRKEFTPEKPLTVQHIIAPDSTQAEFIRDQALSGVDFMELARTHYPGDDNLREELANLGDIGPRDVDSVFYRQALLTAVGSISSPVHTRYGWHIIKVLKRVDAQLVDDARYKILGILEQEGKAKYEADYRAKLFKQYHVEFPARMTPVHLAPYDDRLKTIK